MSYFSNAASDDGSLLWLLTTHLSRITLQLTPALSDWLRACRLYLYSYYRVWRSCSSWWQPDPPHHSLSHTQFDPDHMSVAPLRRVPVAPRKGRAYSVVGNTEPFLDVLSYSLQRPKWMLEDRWHVYRRSGPRRREKYGYASEGTFGCMS